MAHIIRKVRVANPRRKARVARNTKGRFVKRKRSTARKTTARKRNGPAIRRYTVKSLKTELKRRGVKLSHGRKAATKRRVKRSNPVLIELGAINPRRKSVARKSRKRKHNPRRRRATTVARVSNRRRTHRRRRRNPMTTTVVRRRTTKVYNRRRRRNPSLNKSSLEKGGGILVGVAVTKLVQQAIPGALTSMTAGMGGFGPVLVTGAAALVTGWAAEKFMPHSPFADGVMSGGIALTISAAINAMFPQLSVFSLSGMRGMGDIVPGNFVVPQNPLRLPPPPPAPAGNGMGAFRPAFAGAFAR